jgi:hypothetical protein
LSIATTKRDLLESMKDREFRAALNLENVYTTISFQIRALREQRELSQGEFGHLVTPKMAQERISILEDPNADSKPMLNTLLRLADAADVGLEVRFVPFSTVLSRSTHTEMSELMVDSFEDELPELEARIAHENAAEHVEASIPTNHATGTLAATPLESADTPDNVIAFPHWRLTENALAAVEAANAPAPKAAPLAAQAV